MAYLTFELYLEEEADLGRWRCRNVWHCKVCVLLQVLTGGLGCDPHCVWGVCGKNLLKLLRVIKFGFCTIMEACHSKFLLVEIVHSRRLITVEECWDGLSRLLSVHFDPKTELRLFNKVKLGRIMWENDQWNYNQYSKGYDHYSVADDLWYPCRFCPERFLVIPPIANFSSEQIWCILKQLACLE
jgi:hypothetical protein